MICEKADNTDIPTIDAKKYLVASVSQPLLQGLLCWMSDIIVQDLTVGEFIYVIRSHIKLAPEKAIFIFVDNVLPPTAALMSAIYEEHKCVL